MHNNLVIVESPAKAKTIEKFLGDGYKVLSSYGHIRDLRKQAGGIDIEHNFTPLYEVPKDKEKVVAELKKEAKKADKLARLEPLPENPVAPKAQVKPEEFPMEANNPAAAALAALKSAQEAAAAAPATEEKAEVASEEKPTAEEAPVSKPEETKEVKTTTTLSDLEAELESAKGRSTGAKVNAKTKRPRKISDDEVKHEAAPKTPVEQGMAVYTEEELKAIEAEDETAQLYDDGEDDVDYDDYDQYYDDDGK